MRLSVIGTGYVGLVSAVCFAEMGNTVIGVDKDPEKLASLRSGRVPIYEPGLEVLFRRNLEQGRLRFTDNLAEATGESQVIFLCLPTPAGADGAADLRHVLEVTEQLGDLTRENETYRLIVNKSTVPVGTAERMRAILRQRGARNVEVASNPEFLREGFAVEDFMKPDRVVLGAESESALALLRSLYEPFVRQGNPILEMDTRSAEVTKYAANCYLATRITFMNELANFCEQVGANVDLVRKGMGADNRIGRRFLFPGIGYGGSCFPKDVKALIRSARDAGISLRLLETVDTLNAEQRIRFFRKMEAHFGGNLSGRTFGVWGLSFKPNTDDMRDAPSVTVIRMLLERGAQVKAFDPAAMEQAKTRYFGNEIAYAPTMYAAAQDADALVIFTEWNEFRNPDFERLRTALKHPVIFDGRNVFDPDLMGRVGFTYYSVGRKAVLSALDATVSRNPENDPGQGNTRKVNT